MFATHKRQKRLPRCRGDMITTAALGCADEKAKLLFADYLETDEIFFFRLQLWQARILTLINHLYFNNFTSLIAVN